MEKYTDKNATNSSTNTSDKKDGLLDKAGNLVEKLGHKISDAGAPRVGQAIHDLGDKLEKDHKNPSHPHDV